MKFPIYGISLKKRSKPPTSLQLNGYACHNVIVWEDHEPTGVNINQARLGLKLTAHSPFFGYEMEFQENTMGIDS